MAAEKVKEKSDVGDGVAELQSERTSSKRSYRLVVIMLSLLTGLVVLIAFMPLFIVKYVDPTGASSTEVAGHLENIASALVDYSKWTIAVLLGAFGAWIGGRRGLFFRQGKSGREQPVH